MAGSPIAGSPSGTSPTTATPLGDSPAAWDTTIPPTRTTRPHGMRGAKRAPEEQHGQRRDPDGGGHRVHVAEVGDQQGDAGQDVAALLGQAQQGGRARR